MTLNKPEIQRFCLSCLELILGDPGATSRNDAIFSDESLLQELKSPWELILTEPVPEVVEFCPADWAEKYFSAQLAMRPGNSVAFLHEVVFFTDQLSCLARATGRLSRRISATNMQTKPRKSQALTWGLGTNTDQISRRMYLKYILSFCS